MIGAKYLEVQGLELRTALITRTVAGVVIKSMTELDEDKDE